MAKQANTSYGMVIPGYENKSNYGLGSYLSSGGTTGNDWASMLRAQEADFMDSPLEAMTTQYDTSQSLLGNAGTDIVGSGNWWDSTKNPLGDKNFMSGALGLGRLGLGLAEYFQQKPLLEENLKGAKLQNKLATEEASRQTAIRGSLGSAIANSYGSKG